MEDVFNMSSDELSALLTGLAAGQEANVPTEGVCPPSVVALLAAEARASAANHSSPEEWFQLNMEVFRCR